MVKNVLKNKGKSLKLTTLGFMLIELLAVIVILSIIALIATVSVGSVISNSKNELSEIQQNNIEEAAKAYYLKEGMSSNHDCVNVSYLISEGYLEGKEVLDPKTKEEIKGFVKITYEANQYSYKYQEEACIYTAVTEETKTTGSVPTQDSNGNIEPGSEFKIKVSEKIGELTFFVLSNSEDGKYVNLIAEQNITPDGKFTSEPQDGDEWYVTSSNSCDNKYGPQTAYTYLSNATSKWTNVPIIKSFDYIDEGNQSNPKYGYQSLKTKFDKTTGKYITTITPLTETPVTYENMRARLPKYSEVIENTTCEVVISTSDYGSCPLWMVNYLSKTDYYSTKDGKVNSIGENHAYWLLSSLSGVNYSARIVTSYGNVAYVGINYANYGVRPVITVLKSDLLREMK